MTTNIQAIGFASLGSLLGCLLLVATARAADEPLFHHDWHVAGPFSNVDGSGFATEYPPEKGVDLEATYKSAGGADIKWKPILKEGEQPLQPESVDLLEHFRPNMNVCAYAYTTIDCEQARQVSILAGSDDTITVWVNGEKVIASDVYRSADPDTERADVRLAKGKNEILVKVCQGTGGWEFYLRVVGPDPEDLARRHTLENDAVRLVFDYLGRLVEMHNKLTDTSYITKGEATTPVFILDAYSAHQRIYIDDPLLDGGGGFSQADPDALLGTEPTGDLLRLHLEEWRPPQIKIVTKDGVQTLTCGSVPKAGIIVECTVSLPPTGGLSRWQIRVNNRADLLPRKHLRVYRVAFPILSGLCLGGKPEENHLARPYIPGELIPNPSAYSFTRPGRQTRINVLTYPGWASMSWMDLYHAPPANPGKTSGLYFASYDPSFQQLDIEAVPDPEAQTVAMAMRTLAFLEPGEKWQSQTFIVGAHRGDWHWAGDKYREDSKAWITGHDIPEWVSNCDGWFGSGGPNYRYSDLPEMLEQARWLGLNYIQCWS